MSKKRLASYNGDEPESSTRRRSTRVTKTKQEVEYTDEHVGLEPKKLKSCCSRRGRDVKKEVKEVEAVVVVSNGGVKEEEEEEAVVVSNGGVTEEEETVVVCKGDVEEQEEEADPDDEMLFECDEEDVEVVDERMAAAAAAVRKVRSCLKPKVKKKADDEEDEVPPSRFVGDPVPMEEAMRKWPHRYQDYLGEQVAVPGVEKLQAPRHYTQAEVDGKFIISLYDDAYVQGEEGKEDYICKIIEMFEAADGNPYFTAQWFYRAKDTVIKDHGGLIDDKRVFFSEVKDDNPLDCILKKLDIAKVALNVDVEAERAAIPPCDYYYDMMYIFPFSTFVKALPHVGVNASDTKSHSECTAQVQVHQRPQMYLLDLYAGCGGMSTGLCHGANLSGINLVTKWAVDSNPFACESIKLNHPETEVRNESAEDFLSLLREWQKLCIIFSLIDGDVDDQYFDHSEADDNEGDEEEDNSNDEEIFEVEKIFDIRYGDPKAIKNDTKSKAVLHFKVRWKGYGPSEDTWEPIDGLRTCRKTVKEFVIEGYRGNFLPLPGEVDVVCGGPPCQGVSGFNRFRNSESPLDDIKNGQLKVYMNIVDFLKPKFVLMENVVDLLKFSGGYLGRYGLGRMIQMNYQTRIGIMAAGTYGLPQYRMRVFMWGALPSETLPQYPLPTHDAIVKGNGPVEFEENFVRWNENNANLGTKLLLEDAISDLPHITNAEQSDERLYRQAPKTDFQRYIRLGKDQLLNATSETMPNRDIVFDHRPLKLNDDDYQRVCHIPKTKGACFRDLKGVRVRADNKVEWDPDIPRVFLPSGKPLVPEYAMKFVKGYSSKPFARLSWDETISTVVTRAEPHNQKILHPEQDRVLSIRENARLQGFPDYYRLCGPVKERYIQVGNAVALPVARALGYVLGIAIKGKGVPTDGALYHLPSIFPFVAQQLPVSTHPDEVQGHF